MLWQLGLEELHDLHCANLESLDHELRNHVATTYGIIRNSVLNSSSYFHFVLGLAMDCMHDGLEGVVQLQTKEMLQYCIRNRMFTVEQLNQRLAAFAFSKSDAANKPTPLSMEKIHSDDGKLCESG